jgi:glutathione S-transferase
MITLHHAPLTRSVRILWLLEELGLPYRLETVRFAVPVRPFSQQTPSGKLPVIEDGDLVLFESGAILEYLLERYGEGRLAPAPGTPLRGPFLQWVHFAEATLMPPLGHLVRHLVFKPEAERIPAVVAEARALAAAALDVVERALAGRAHLLGDAFSAADIMMGYGVQAAQWYGVLGAPHPHAAAYLARLAERPAFRVAWAR